MEFRPPHIETLRLPEEAIFGVSSVRSEPQYIKIASSTGDGMFPIKYRDHFRGAPFFPLRHNSLFIDAGWRKALTFGSLNCCSAERLEFPHLHTCIYTIPYLLGEQKKMDRRDQALALRIFVISGFEDPLPTVNCCR